MTGYGKERIVKHYAILIHLRHFSVHPNRRVVLIEYVFHIVVLIQKSQRYVRLDMLVAANIFQFIIAVFFKDLLR